MKYIIVTGGVISGVGKGVIASSFGAILKSCNINVTSIKIDPYINIDAGTFSPYEHGEVFVLDDGGEVDLDLGNYERFMDITLHRDNNITTGKIYQQVINKERKGDYLGKTVQVIPHITDAIQEWVENVAHKPVTQDGTIPEVCIVELGGTIGDIEGMPFVEAFRQFQFRVNGKFREKRQNICFVHVSLVPKIKTTAEHKTKPTQASVHKLRDLGISPDLIVCRSSVPIDDSIKNKISNFCHVPPQQVIGIHDVPSIYHVPLLMDQQGIVEFFNNHLNLNISIPTPRNFISKWKDLAERCDKLTKDVKISLVGKYTKLQDSYASVRKALQHACTLAGYKLDLRYIDSSHLENDKLDPVLYHESWRELCDSDGVIVPGGFGSRGVEGMINASKWCREQNKPFLGICLGLQTSVIEFARNELNLQDANSTEINPETSHPVVIEMEEHNPGEMGGTMRLGKRVTLFTDENSTMKTLYGNKKSIEERHRHRYEVNPDYISQFEGAGLKFVGFDQDKERMEIVELENHPYYVAVQFHPEYLSRPSNPSPPFLGLILAATVRLKSYIAKGCKLTPLELSDESDFELFDN